MSVKILYSHFCYGNESNETELWFFFFPASACRTQTYWHTEFKFTNIISKALILMFGLTCVDWWWDRKQTVEDCKQRVEACGGGVWVLQECQRVVPHSITHFTVTVSPCKIHYQDEKMFTWEMMHHGSITISDLLISDKEKENIMLLQHALKFTWKGQLSLPWGWRAKCFSIWGWL